MTGAEAAALFKAMADRISKNPDEFQGAYLVVGPDGITVTNALFGPKPNIGLFWATAANHVKVEADAAASAADQANKNAGVYGRR